MEDNSMSIWDTDDETPFRSTVYAPSIEKNDVLCSLILTPGLLEYPIRPKIHDFKTLSIDKRLLDGYSHCEFLRPFKMQGQALPLLFDKTEDHVVIHAPDKSGKTVAGLMTVLQRIKPHEKHLQAVVVCPTCEVTKKNYQLLTSMTVCHKTLIVQSVIRARYGKNNKSKEKTEPHLLVGTPGKILDFAKKYSSFNKVQWIILDGMESMISDRGHQNSLRNIAERAHPYHLFLMLCSLPRSSTTQDFQNQLCRINPFIMEFENTTEERNVDAYFASYDSMNNRLSYLEMILRETRGQIIVFCKTKEDSLSVSDYLTEKNYSAGCICGKISSSKREETGQLFQDGSLRILVITPAFDDTQAENLQVVINFDVIQNQDGFLDHYAYQKRKGLLRKNSKGFVLNLLTNRWADCAVDENNAKINIYTRESLQNEIRKKLRYSP